MRLLEFEGTDESAPIVLVAEEISSVIGDGSHWTRIRMRNGYLVEIDVPHGEVVRRLKEAIA